MLRPTLCVSALVMAVPARAALIASWDFNDSTLAPSVGAGVLTTDVDSVRFVTGTTVNALPSAPAGYALALTFTSDDERSFTLGFDATGLEDLVVSVAWCRDNRSFNSNRVSWSTDGTNFAELKHNVKSRGSDFGVQVLDFSSIPVVDGASSVFVVFAIGGAGNGGAEIQVDNIQIAGAPAPAPAGLGALGLAGLLGLRRRR